MRLDDSARSAETPVSRRLCSTCTGAGRLFDAAHPYSVICPSCDGSGMRATRNRGW